MTTKNEHNARLILDVNDMAIAQTASTPPRTFVIVSGEARTNATNPRLTRSALPSIPETLQLDFEADDGLLQVITRVTAMFEIEIEIEESHAHSGVTVHAATSSITRELPKAGAASAGAGTQAVTNVIFDVNPDQLALAVRASTDGNDTFTFVGGAGDTRVTVRDSRNNETSALFGTSSFKVEASGSVRQTVRAHGSNTETDYAIFLDTPLSTPVKGYIKVKGSGGF